MADRGVTALANELVGEASDEDEAPDQLALFAEPVTAAGARKAVERGWNGVGRKPGARNKRTLASIEFILSRHRDPRLVLAEMAEANVFDLAAMLGCSPLEAYQEKRLAAIGLLPFVAARVTPEVHHDTRAILHLTINDGAAEFGAGAGAGIVLDRIEYAPEDTEEEPDG